MNESDYKLPVVDCWKRPNACANCPRRSIKVIHCFCAQSCCHLHLPRCFCQIPNEATAASCQRLPICLSPSPSHRSRRNGESPVISWTSVYGGHEIPRIIIFLTLTPNYSHETSIMLLRHLNEKPTAVEGLAMGGKNVSKEDRVVFAQTALGDFERRWKVEGKRL